MRKPGKEALKKITDDVNDFLKRVSKGRSQLERLWFQSVLFERGVQWVSFSDLNGTFQRSNNTKAIPRPVTNRYSEAGTSLVSTMLNFDPRTTFAPQTSTTEDMHSAMAAGQIVKSIENEVNWFQVRTEAAPWLVYTGNVFFLLGFDPDQGKVDQYGKMACINSMYDGDCDYQKDVPLQEMQEPQSCPNCSPDPAQPAPLVPMTGPDGQPVIENKRQGAMVAEAINPFEIFFDYALPCFDESPMVARIHSRTPCWVKEKFNLSEEPEPMRRQELNARFRTGMKNFIPTGEESPMEGVDVVEVWCKPSKKYKKGFYMVIVGEDEVVHYEDYPWISKEGKVFLPLVHQIYQRTPGSAYGKTPMFDVLEKQVMRNKVESLREMYLNRMSSPVWLLPRGTETDPSGHVGHLLKYDPSTTGTHFPRRDEPQPGGTATFNDTLDRIDADIYKIIGSSEVLRGERPKNRQSGYSVEKLEDLAKSRQSSQFSQMTIASVKIMIAMLEIFRIVAPANRYTRVFGTSGAGWTIKKIDDLDLKGGVDIWAEPGGTLPKTPLERQAQLDMFIQSGLVNIADPIMVSRIFTMYGMEDLAPDMNMDLMQIAREEDKFFNLGQEIMVHPWDNHQLHSISHGQKMKTEAFEELAATNPQMAQMFLIHKQMHDLEVQALMAQQQPAEPPKKGGPQ